MKKSKNIFFKKVELVLLFSMLIFLTGCWDYQDINNRTIGISVGIDKIDGNYEFTSGAAMLTTGQGKSNEKTEVTGEYFIMSSGKTFEEARTDYDMKIPFEDFSGSVKVVVLGRNFALDGIEPYINRIDKLYGYRKTVLLVLSRETPRELLKTKVKNDVSIGFLIDDTITYLSKDGSTLYRNLGDILMDISMKEVGFVLPYIGQEGDEIKVLGLGVMKNSKLAGILEGENSKGVLYLLARNPRFIEAIPEPDNKNILSFQITTKKRKIETSYKNNRIEINISVNLNAVLQYEYYFNSIYRKDIKNYEQIISEKVEGQIKQALQKTQKQWECDVFQFARHFKAQHPKVYEKISWAEEYPDAIINVKVNTKIASLGFLDPNAKNRY